VRRVLPKGPWNCGQLGVVVDDGVDGVHGAGAENREIHKKNVASELLFFSRFWTRINDYFEGPEGRQTEVAIQFASSQSESAIEAKSLLIAIDFRAAKRGLKDQGRGTSENW
jgi:hypothetical protein